MILQGDVVLLETTFMIPAKTGKGETKEKSRMCGGMGRGGAVMWCVELGDPRRIKT